jgi:protein O-GlcNAc transferase
MRILLFSVIVVTLISSCAWFTSAPPKDEAESVDRTRAQIAPEVRLKAENYFDEGFNYYQNEDYNSAIESWKQAIELLPGDAELHNFIGITYHKLNKINDAISHFQIATELDTNYYQAYNNLGYLLFLRKDYDRAKKAFNKALKINPDYYEAKLNFEDTKRAMSGDVQREVFELTREAVNMEDVDEQVWYYQKILSIDSTYAKAHNNLGAAYFYADNFDSAYYHFNKAVELKKDYPEALYNLGYLYKLDGRYEDAIKLFLRASSLKPKYTLALNNLGETYFLKGENENAMRVFQTVLDVNPDDTFAQEYMDKISTTTKDKPEE